MSFSGPLAAFLLDLPAHLGVAGDAMVVVATVVVMMMAVMTGMVLACAPACTSDPWSTPVSTERVSDRLNAAKQMDGMLSNHLRFTSAPLKQDMEVGAGFSYCTVYSIDDSRSRVPWLGGESSIAPSLPDPVPASRRHVHVHRRTTSAELVALAGRASSPWSATVVCGIEV